MAITNIKSTGVKFHPYAVKKKMNIKKIGTMFNLSWKAARQVRESIQKRMTKPSK